MNCFELEVPADNSRLNEIAEFVENVLTRFGLTETVKGRLSLAIDECVTNIVCYGYPDQQGLLKLRIKKMAHAIHVDIEDHGIPFDPTQSPEPDVAGPIEERSIGGLGIHLTRNMVDDIHYRRDRNVNHLTLITKL